MPASLRPDRRGLGEEPDRALKHNVALDWFERWVRERKCDWEKSPVDSKTDSQS